MFLKYLRNSDAAALLEARESGQAALHGTIDIVAAHHINCVNTPKGRVNRAIHVYLDIAGVLGYLPKSRKK